jgi:soluble lytic murein transglycosylase-like protein
MLSTLALFIFLNTQGINSCQETLIQPQDPDPVTEVVFKRAHLLQTSLAPQDPLDIVKAAQEAKGRYDVDLALVLAMIEIESRYSKRAKSKKGCLGLLQVSKSTGRYMAEKLGLDPRNLTEVRNNILVGMAYLKELLIQYGDLKTAVTIYNKGIVNYLDNPTVSGYSRAVMRRYDYLKKVLAKPQGIECHK